MARVAIKLLNGIFCNPQSRVHSDVAAAADLLDQEFADNLEERRRIGIPLSPDDDETAWFLLRARNLLAECPDSPIAAIMVARIAAYAVGETNILPALRDCLARLDECVPCAASGRKLWDLIEDPLYGELLEAIAELHYRDDRYQSAVKVLRRGLRTRVPCKDGIVELLLRSHFELDEWQSALKVARAYVDPDCSSFELHMDLWFLEREAGRDVVSFSSLRRALLLNPSIAYVIKHSLPLLTERGESRALSADQLSAIRYLESRLPVWVLETDALECLKAHLELPEIARVVSEYSSGKESTSGSRGSTGQIYATHERPEKLMEGVTDATSEELLRASKASATRKLH